MLKLLEKLEPLKPPLIADSSFEESGFRIEEIVVKSVTQRRRNVIRRLRKKHDSAFWNENINLTLIKKIEHVIKITEDSSFEEHYSLS